MRELMAAAEKDLCRYLRDPAALALWLGIPLVIGGLFILALGGDSGPAPQVHLLVADEDGGFLSRMLIGAMQQGRAGDILRAEKVNQEIGRRRMDHGEASALVVIPKGFSLAVLKEEPTKLLLITNPSQRVLPGIAEELLKILADVVFYAHRLLGPEIKAVLQGSPAGQSALPDADVARLVAAINQDVRKVEKYIFPPVIELEATVVKPPSESSAPAVPRQFYFLPGMLIVGLLFASQGLSGDVWREREAGLLRRIAASPLGITRFLLGKLLADAAILAGLSLILLAGGMAYFKVPWNRLPQALAWAVAVGLMLTVLMLIIQLLASTRRGASLLSFALVLPLMMIGGGVFPLEQMPRWLAAIGRWSPGGWANEQLKAILLNRTGAMAMPLAFVVVAVVTAAFVFLADLRMRRVFARS
jgi:ABC-type multidrug transport system permease subunit